MSDISNHIKDVIAKEPVVLFMKGTPQFIMCGNSDRALRALREAGAPVTAVNILADPASAKRPAGVRILQNDAFDFRHVADRR